MRFSERLFVPWWWPLIGALLVGSLGIAVAAYVPPWIGAVFGISCAAVLVFGLAFYSALRITVDDQQLRVGRYRLEHRYIASATAYTGEQARAAVGPEADHRAFLVLRPYLNDVVKFTLNDPADPHPYWLVSTRRAAELVAALEEYQ